MNQKFRVFLITALVIYLSQVTALNTIKGNLFINDQLRGKELIIDPLQAQFPPQRHFTSLLQEDQVSDDGEEKQVEQNQQVDQQQQEQQQNGLTQHEQAVDSAKTGLITNNIWCEQCQMNNLKVSQKLIGESLSVNIIKGERNLENPLLDGVITILGDLSISDKKPEEAEQSNLNISLLQSKSLTINGVKQWTLLDSESFSFTKSQSNATLLQNGWRIIKSESSSSLPLKTNDDEMAQASLNEKIVRLFEDIPEHNHLKVEGNFYFLSPFWKGESAQIRINRKVVWMDSHKWTENLISGIEDICQLNIKDFNQYVWIQPISFVINHKQPTFELELGLTKSIDEILKCSEFSDKLDQIPIFGFDDFSLYIK